jgi:hypothetical protein
VVVFLNGLSPCLGAADAAAGEFREVLRKGLPLVQGGDALLLNRSAYIKITETAMSCVPPHLLQRTKILYLAAEFFVVGGIASCMPSFSCMMAGIVRCFGDSVKDEKRAILATRPTRCTMN